MARGVNKVILVANMGADPEIKYLQSGGAVTNITVATSESWTDKQTGEKKDSVEWHRCVAYQRLAEIIGEYTRKGSKVYIEGKLKTRKWQDQQGVERYTTEIIIDELQLLDSAPAGGQGATGGQRQPQGQQGGHPQQQARPQGQAQRPPAQQQPYNQHAPIGYNPGGSAAPNNHGFTPNHPQGMPQQPNIDFDPDIPF